MFINKKAFRKVIIMTNGFEEPGFWRRHEHVIAWIVGIVLLVIVGFLLWGLFAGEKEEKVDCGEDVSCFVQNAQRCSPAVMERRIAGSVMRYETTDGCTFIKSFSVISASEPRPVHELFGGKMMTCTYEKGSFDMRWINTLTGDIARCEGELRDAFVELMSAQEELEVQALQRV